MDQTSIVSESRRLLLYLDAAVALPVPWEKINGDKDAEEAREKEWKGLIDACTYELSVLYEWDKLASWAAVNGKVIHFGCPFGIMVLKTFELPKGDKRRKFEYRMCLQGNNVVSRNKTICILQDLDSSPACMVAWKTSDCHSCFPGNHSEQAHACSACIQANFKGEDS